MKMDKDFKALLNKGSVAFFGAGKNCPAILCERDKGRLEVFSSKRESVKGFYDKRRQTLNSLSDISRRGADVCFLDNEARGVLLAKYPNYAQFVFVRISLTSEILLGVVGLARRYWRGMVKLSGIVRLKNVEIGSSTWLVIKNTTTQVEDPIYLSVSDEIGVQGLVDFMNENNIDYVIPRFFEKLPDLHRTNGGDLDLLVGDECAHEVRVFLRNNPGKIPVDLHTVSGPAPGSSGMPYFPPLKAKEMLEGRVSGPIGAWIPSPKDHFYAFLYHVVYHKGFFSGVKSTKYSGSSNANPENDYGTISAKLAEKLGQSMDLSLEGMERVLSQSGWVPKLDTLAAIARLNEWVRWHYFSSREILEVGLSVVVLKKIAEKNGWIDSIEADFKEQDFEVVLFKKFSDVEVVEMSQVLRGGNWYTSRGEVKDYLPHSAYVLKDKRHRSPVKVVPGTKEARIRVLKTYLRNKYSKSLDSFIHATDDTDQSWEYIDDIFETKGREIVEGAIGNLPETKKQSAFSWVKLGLHKFKERAKAKILEHFE